MPNKLQAYAEQAERTRAADHRQPFSVDGVSDHRRKAV